MYSLICRALFNVLIKGAWDSFRYRVIVVSTGSQDLREGEEVASCKP